MNTRPVIDVSDLPHHGFDTVDTIWWGNNLLLAIETSMFAILIATYFYLRQNISPWPPPLAQLTAPFSPLPGLGFGTANALVLLLSCLVMMWVDLSARRGSQGATQRGLIICLVFAFIAIILRSFEFRAVKFRWDSNAYGSVVWFILGMHMLHLITLTCETVLLTGWALTRDFDMKHRVDITALAVYWYWVAGIWMVLYAVVYWAPRFS
ncbi:MAG TPA: cytochrome c oxidase subunit 3 [Pyrinomonadaceae bacterium]|jgi:heme/copper-type cytochrome/quinol oxidase subunit 3|nr:cytochrome c oxidase subunit 3 [Pyrinomonadaceae bacterium]